MKKATLCALIGFAILILVNLYYFINSCILVSEMPEYNMFYVFINLIRTLAIAGIWYFFFILYKKQPK